MLNVDDAPRYLFEQGLISEEAILHRGLTITSVARRNRSLRVELGDGSGYLIKQPEHSIYGGGGLLSSEAAFYAFCWNEPAVEALCASLPRVAHVDPERGLFALSLVEGALPLWRCASSPGGAAQLVDASRLFGRALALVHGTFMDARLRADPRLSFLRDGAPFIFDLHRPSPELLSNISPASYEVLHIIQSDALLMERMDELRGLLRSETVIHNDVKLDNLLIVTEPSRGDVCRICVVDWEHVQLGDPAWDLAGALKDFVALWILSMPSHAPPGQMIEGAALPMSAIQPAIRAFFEAYRDARGLPLGETREVVRRAVRFSAARLIQTVYEMANGLRALHAHPVMILQIAANLFADPGRGQSQLYGLSETTGGA
ncbi:phosphotransferase [Sorangium sp. So ce296]|uniref:phosphotransferase n=1 Tax=Sorangium sp. So ce296 TaxID=3133296 RepID=UPI003F63EBE4